MYHIRIGVKSVQGHCLYEHKPGDDILYDGATFHGKLCDSACAAMIHAINAMRYGAEYPWMQNDTVAFSCPDPENLVVFLLKREPEEANPDAFQFPKTPN
jgi:uncharacterized repeat protein (TIGR04076 family)